MGMYKVQFRAIDALNEKTSWSPVISFTMVPVPTTNLTPLSTFYRTPVLRWSPVLGARGYDVVLRDQKTGGTIHQASEVRWPVWKIPQTFLSEASPGRSVLLLSMTFTVPGVLFAI